MGWCTGAVEIFDSMVRLLLKSDADYKHKFAVLLNLAEALEAEDWDCQSDTLYYEDPLVQAVFFRLHPDWFLGIDPTEKDVES